MILEVKEITPDNVAELLGKLKKKKKKTVAEHFGKLKRGIDGLEYQKKMRSEWD